MLLRAASRLCRNVRQKSQFAKVIFLIALSISSRAGAQPVNGTVTGTIIDWTDSFGYFGKAGAEILGANYSLNYSYNPADFTNTSCGDGCNLYNSDTPGAMTLIMTIGKKSIKIVSSCNAEVEISNGSPSEQLVELVACENSPPYSFMDVIYNQSGSASFTNLTPPSSGDTMIATVELNDNLEEGYVTAPCGDTRDQIVQEYQSYKVYYLDASQTKHSWQPACTLFTESARGPDYTFMQFNSGDFPWALVRQEIVSAYPNPGVDSWVQYIGDGQYRPINSGYRNPGHNAGTSGSAKGSRHMFGSAVDLKNLDKSKSEYDELSSAAYMAGASWVEPWSETKTKASPCYSHCVHADWGYFGEGYAQ